MGLITALTRRRDHTAAPTDGPAPALPFTLGLGPLLEATAAAVGRKPPGKLRRAVADRYSISVTDDAIETRGILRSHRARWDRMETVELEPTGTLAARRVVGGALRRFAGRAVPWPVLRQLVQKGVSVVLVEPITRAAGAVVSDRTPDAFVAARTRKGDGVSLDGALALMSVLSSELTDVVVSQAKQRGVPVERTDD